MNGTGILTGRIDVHAHFFPPFFKKALAAAGRHEVGGFEIADWPVDENLDYMDRHGIAAQVLSISDPGLTFLSGREAQTMARRINEHAAQRVSEHPDRFGALAVLPMDDPEAAVRELAYAHDVLRLDGAAVLSSYHGVYVGDPRLDAVLAALDERGAYVMVHPASPPADAAPDMGIPHAIVEYTFETTRAITSLVWTGAAQRFPNIRWSFAHLGGAAPFLAYRITGLKSDDQVTPWASTIGRFYYDTALNPVRPAITAALEVAPLSHLLYGSDSPFANFLYPPDGDTAPALGDSLDAAGLRAVGRDNALALFPRLAAAIAAAEAEAGAEPVPVA